MSGMEEAFAARLNQSNHSAMEERLTAGGMPLSLKILARFAPRPPRAAVSICAWLLLPDDRAVVIKIKDISPQGFSGDTSANLRPGISIGIMLPGSGIVRANIRWCEHGSIGAKFGKAVDVERIREAFPAWQ
jgi:hypothetical protein